MSIDNQWGNPAENMDHLKSEYINVLDNNRKLAETNEENTLNIIKAIEDAMKRGDSEFIQKCLDVLKQTTATNKIVYVDALDELQQAKIEGAEFMKPSLN